MPLYRFSKTSPSKQRFLLVCISTTELVTSDHVPEDKTQNQMFFLYLLNQ